MNLTPNSHQAASVHGERRSNTEVGGRRPRFQVSLSLMLLLMVVFAFISAALFYAARVPMIREELSVLLYGEARDGGEDVGRLAHRAFIMFTFTSPLLLAGMLSLMVTVINWLSRR
ncbi:hypothetical protein [Roseiconus lacunae]|uniref:Uncharacterized protein n=2 Tax=Roseiconus lacunae TaxID=2605694 RepID=A0ABT7PJZ0_9BACT|nr:hypothetical protein [Roseiconus lacunae]MCD0459394.1 hypothetical protein [Roseiconus lacunae]MDM4016821.1 hypothetical protein [Roseiconus lacunae]